MRCFIAAWPDAPTRLALAALTAEVRQRIKHRRASRAEDMHLTLAFIGALTHDKAVAVADATEKLQFAPFALRLDTLGFFAEAGVVWAGADNETTQPLVELADRVRAALDLMNLAYDRRPLAPHVTLLRGVMQCEQQSIAPIAWRIDSIALYCSAPQPSAARYTRVMR